MAVRVHHCTGSRSCRVLWLLEELGVGYQVESLGFSDGSLKQPEYLAKNPLGKVPTLEDDGVVLYESGAILEYLLERYGAGRLAPQPGTAERALYLQWLHFVEAAIMPPLREIFMNTFMGPEEERRPELLPDARKRFERALAVLEDALDDREFLVGGELTAADIQLGYSLQLARLTGNLGDGFANLGAYLERLAARPAFQKAFSV